MNQSIGAYNPPSFTMPMSGDYRSFVQAVENFLVNQQGQYQQQYFTVLVNILNSATQGFGADLPATTTLNITNWAHRISGMGAIATITPPNGYQSFIVLLSLNGFSFAAGGNISNPVAVTAGHPALCIFDPVGLNWWVLTA